MISENAKKIGIKYIGLGLDFSLTPIEFLGKIKLKLNAILEYIEENLDIEEDLSLKQDKVDNTLTTTSKEIVNAINELNTKTNNKQDKTDNNLETSSKQVVGAINELNTKLNNKQDKVDNTLTTTNKQIVNAINEIKNNKRDKSTVVFWKKSRPKLTIIYFIL